jgi:hypothetical protein
MTARRDAIPGAAFQSGLLPGSIRALLQFPGVGARLRPPQADVPTSFSGISPAAQASACAHFLSGGDLRWL